MVLSCVLIGSAGADITAGLVAYWPLHGDARDASGNGLHGVKVGNPTYVDEIIGQVINLDGDGDYVDCTANAAFDITDAITVAAWIKVHTFDKQWQYVVGKGDSAWRIVRETTTNTVRWRANGPSPNMAVTGKVNVNDGKWHHLAGTYDGSAAILYVDGVVDTSLKCSGAISKNTYPVWIGQCSQQKNRAWNGRLGEVRVYRRALSAAEVEELVRFVPNPWVKAWEPQPVDGAVGISIPLLQWKAGMTAVVHNVYVGARPDLGPADLVASNLTTTAHFYATPLLPGTTYYWRVDEVEADLTTVHTGEVWSFISQALTAYHPNPADGDGNLSTAVTLTWLPGKDALKHHLYFSDSRDGVTNAAAAADKGELKDATFQPTGLLDATTYYWRVDEVLVDGTARAGAVWSFSTFLPVEDFESYTDQEGGAIYLTWRDGFDDKSSGSRVGYLDPKNGTYGETGIVHAGKQSMPLDYNNTKTPFYSETEREFATVQDWTRNGSDTLVLYVQGKSANSPASLYIAVEDSTNHLGVAAYPDPAVTTQTKWTEWKIPLGQFTAAGVNLARVKRMYLGLGDRKNPIVDGSGLIYIDDLRVIKATTTP